MKATTEETGACQIALTIEAEAAELESSMEHAYRQLVKRVSVPGFRKGKAPRAILEQHVGRKALLDEALEHLIPELYREAIDSNGIEPIASPEIEITQVEPVAFRVVVPLKPKVELGDYHGIRLQPEPVEVSDADIEAAMQAIREEHGAWVPVERPVEFNDLITMDVAAKVGDTEWLNHKDIVYAVQENAISPVRGFTAELVGMAKNSGKSFVLTIPDDHQIDDFRGKQCRFQVTVSEVKARQLPEMDDDLAESAGCDSLAALREKVAGDLRARGEAQNRAELRQRAVESLVEVSEVQYPPVVEEEELNGLLSEQARRFGFKEVADFVRAVNRTEEDIRSELRPVAQKRLVEGLALSRFAEVEKIEIESSEVDNRVEEISGRAEDKEKAGEFLALPQVRQSIEQSLHTEKTIDRLEQIATAGADSTVKEE